MSTVSKRFTAVFLKIAVPAACATLLWTGAALATTTAQQKCDSARITAWKKYQSCVDGPVAKAVNGNISNAAFAKCRHKYFAKWTGFQSTGSLSGSTCVGTRFTDNGDQTVTDNLSGLVWEKKDNAGLIHDKDNVYTWSTGAPYKENGTAFTSFLAGAVTGLNMAGFGGANGWRLPTLAELQTIVLDFPCKGDGFSPTCICPSSPCVDPALDATNTQSNFYFSATTFISSDSAWDLDFISADVNTGGKTNLEYVRAVRGGL